MNLISKSPNETIRLGRRMGKYLVAGDIIGLAGELGAGKTTFVKGLAEGLKVREKGLICSPSFVILKEYQGRLPLYHLDFYRIERIKDIYRIGYEEYFYGEGVTVIEWAEKAERLLPKNYLRIELYIRDTHIRLIKLIPKGSRYKELVKKLY
jgi:tRNA threonylcarbamoyladenosine biosynthesis protein TsaE